MDIVELKMNVYHHWHDCGWDAVFNLPNLPSIARLISNCPTLNELTLQSVVVCTDDDVDHGCCPSGEQQKEAEHYQGLGLLSAMEKLGLSRGALHALTDLSFEDASEARPLFLSRFDLGKSDFKNLTSLRLHKHEIESAAAWEEFLINAKESLESLELEHVTVYGCSRGSDYPILPNPLPKLKRLKIHFAEYSQCDPDQMFVENVVLCLALEHVELQFSVGEYETYMSGFYHQALVLKLYMEWETKGNGEERDVEKEAAKKAKWEEVFGEPVQHIASACAQDSHLVSQ